MTVSSTDQMTSGTTGTGAEQDIAFTFPCLAASEIKAVIQHATTGAITELVKDTHYSVALTGTGSPNYTGGTITTLTPFVSSSYDIYVYRQVTQTQAYNPEDNDAFPADTVEQQFDKLQMQIDDLREIVGRCIKIPRPESNTVEVDNYIDRASTTIGFDANGDVTVS